MLSIGILWSRCTVEFWPTYCVKLHRSSSSLVHEYWSLTRSSWPLLMGTSTTWKYVRYEYLVVDARNLPSFGDLMTSLFKTSLTGFLRADLTCHGLLVSSIFGVLKHLTTKRCVTLIPYE
ncbi:hypothetical protein DD238_004555 [Peronospora effusa]|uniref:Uncharacterized protein n=1 Tax=Peronospora effusa TaxID=542832 RepID=A0A3M6VCF9_9STRA|nr:hypothetical protein DD238_004555 [Peronospora effusa]RQM14161.1 hypothetical protein DD237_004834 [Peronospora effusa]